MFVIVQFLPLFVIESNVIIYKIKIQFSVPGSVLNAPFFAIDTLLKLLALVILFEQQHQKKRPDGHVRDNERAQY